MRLGVLAVLLGLALAAGGQRPSLGNKRRDVYIAGFFPYAKGVAESSTGRGVMPSVMLAVDHINENQTVLRNYMLHMYWNDTKCNAAVGVKAFFDMMHIGPHKVMLFGAACTQVTDPIAKASKRWHLTQLSYADTHPMFTSDHFPNFFRVVPSENAFNAPRLKLLEHFNWTRVGTIYQNEPRYSLAHNRLVSDLDALRYQVEETQSFATEVKTTLNKLKEKDVRIILGNFNETWARRIFCEAYNQEMFGRKYQWLIMGTYSEAWWEKEDPHLNCTPIEVAAALEGCILTDLLPLSTSGRRTVSGITADEYRIEYDSRRGKEYSRFHGYTYDGIWAVALAIQHVAHRIRHVRKNQTVGDFRYRDPLWETLFLEALRSTNFEGVTGPVKFYDNERKASILLKQFQNGSEVKVGEFNGVTGELDLSTGEEIQWQGRYPPKDRTLMLVEHSHVNITIYSILASAASVGILMAILFLAVNITYRNQRYIKMSSPYLNNLIIIGCMLTYSSVIFLGLDSTLTSVDTFPYICTARAWLLMAGFSLAFGSMFSKTWRVHSIFTDVKLNKKVIKDYQLFMVVGVLLVIDLAIMTTWQVADPFYRETKKMEPYPHPSSDDIMIVPENEYCQSERMTVFVSSIYAYKGLLMIFGAFLAWETRHVSIPALNDSKYVGMSVYNVVIMCVMGAAISFVLSDKQDASFIIISVFIIFCTTGTLCLVFVPKLIELRRNPQGSIDKRIRATLRPMSKNRRDSVASEMEERIKDAKVFNQKYRKQLLERDAELQALLRRLGEEALPPQEPPSHMDRLTVPKPEGLKKEAPSGTETTDISSLCSLNSDQEAGEYVSLATETPGPRKKTTFASRLATVAHTDAVAEVSSDYSPSCPRDREVPSLGSDRSALRFVPEGFEEELLPEEKSLIEELIEDRPRLPTPPPPLTKVVSFGDVTNGIIGGSGCGNILLEDTILPPPKQFKPSRHSPSASSTRNCPHQQSMPTTMTTQVPPSALRRRSSVKSGGCGSSTTLDTRRRPSMPCRSPHRSTEGLSGESRCEAHPRGPALTYVPLHSAALLLNGSDGSAPDVTSHRDSDPEEALASPMQRSVSEKSRERCMGHGTTSVTIPTSKNSAGVVSVVGVPLNRHQRTSTSARSTPNVASSGRGGHQASSTGVSVVGGTAVNSSTTASAMCSAVSEGELLDLAILPIFQKLLSERHKSRTGYGASIASCPNISIKCDIVEYL